MRFVLSYFGDEREPSSTAQLKSVTCRDIDTAITKHAFIVSGKQLNQRFTAWEACFSMAACSTVRGSTERLPPACLAYFWSMTKAVLRRSSCDLIGSERAAVAAAVLSLGIPAG